MLMWRGKIYSPNSAVECKVFEDGGLVVADGRVVELGEAQEMLDKYKCELKNFVGAMVPAFCDIHLHWVQNRVKGSFEGELLPWLRDGVWPEEGKFEDSEYAREVLGEFWREIEVAGTVAGGIYSSVHREATEMALEQAGDHGCFVVGNVLMDQNSPEGLEMGFEDEMKMVEDFAKRYGRRYAVTPRFAPTCTMELMKGVGQIAAEHGLVVQSHLSENLDEIAWVKELFPGIETYTEVYAEAGLLNERSIMGHCIHLSEKEWEIFAASGAVVAHCPTSNKALGSGRMPLEKLREYGIRFALGTDIGAGPGLEMEDVMREFLAVHRESGVEVSFEEALYRATLAGCEILGCADKYGNFEAGKIAKFKIIDEK
ncbi:amidohydrolase family protein [Patescibacteria group bacterium]|nr:amidohydrolase family protein [Patescibacteria group bacterium]